MYNDINTAVNHNNYDSGDTSTLTIFRDDHHNDNNTRWHGNEYIVIETMLDIWWQYVTITATRIIMFADSSHCVEPPIPQNRSVNWNHPVMEWLVKLPKSDLWTSLNKLGPTNYWLVVLTCLKHLAKYEFVNGKDYPIYEMENKKCLKPPTSHWINCGQLMKSSARGIAKSGTFPRLSDQEFQDGGTAHHHDHKGHSCQELP